MVLLVLVVWWTFPFVLVGLWMLAQRWYVRRDRRRFERGEARLLAMHERHAVAILRPNGDVSNVVPIVSRRRDGAA